jgi:Zn-dependent protease with chaperone function
MLLFVLFAIACGLAVRRGLPAANVHDPFLVAAKTWCGATAVVAAGYLSARCRDLPKRWRGRADWPLLIWLITAGTTILAGHWARLVRYNLRLDCLILIDELVILAPLVMPWLGVWVCGSRSRQLTWQESLQVAWRRFRLVAALVLVPILVVCLAADVAEWVRPGFSHQRHAVFVFLTPLVILFLVYPFVLSAVWQTSSLPRGTLRDRLEDWARRLNVHYRDIRVWHTGQQIVNAAVAGVISPVRFVFLTDGLLRHLSDDEIEAAFVHELAHVRHRHLIWRMLALLLPVNVAVFFSHCDAARWLVASALPSTSDLCPTWIPVAVTLAYLMIVLAWYSRRLELEADLWACGSLAASCHDRRLAIQRYLEVLRCLAERSGGTRWGWLHPSFCQRRLFLIRTACDAHRAARFTREMRCLAGAIVVLSLLPPVWLVVHYALP